MGPRLDADAVIEKLIGALLDPEQWPLALRAVADFCNADHGVCHMIGPSGVNSFVSKESEELAYDFRHGSWDVHNLRMQRGVEFTRKGARGLLTEWKCLTTEELSSNPFEQEFATRHANQHYAGGALAHHLGSNVVFTVERDVAKGAYLNGDLAMTTLLFNRLASTLGYVLRMHVDATKAIVDAFGASGEAHAWVDATGRLLHATASFESLVGTIIAVRGGRIHALDKNVDADLQHLISQTGSADKPSINSFREVRLGLGGAVAAVARALPIRGPARDMVGSASVLLSIVTDAPKISVRHEILQSLYKLTSAEARLASALGSGKSLRDVSALENITFETARTRLKVIFQKTGVGRQVDLALLIERLSRISVSSGRGMA